MDYELSPQDLDAILRLSPDEVSNERAPEVKAEWVPSLIAALRQVRAECAALAALAALHEKREAVIRAARDVARSGFSPGPGNKWVDVQVDPAEWEDLIEAFAALDRAA